MDTPSVKGVLRNESLPVNSVGKAGRPFEKPAVVVGDANRQNGTSSA